MQQQAHQVFSDLYLEEAASATVTDIATSRALNALGNKTVLAISVTNSANLVNTGSPALRVIVQGSLDGSAWVDVITEEITGTDITAGAPEYFQEIANSDWSYPFARVSITLLSSGASITAILLSVSIAFSKQS